MISGDFLASLMDVLRGRMMKVAMGASVAFGTILLSQFLFSIVVVRYLGVELFGAYQYLGAAISFLGVFHSPFSRSIVRFVPEMPESERDDFVLGVGFCQIVAFLSWVVICGLGLWIAGSGLLLQAERHLGSTVTWLLVLLVPVTTIKAWLASYLVALQKVGQVQIVEVSASVVELILWILISGFVAERQAGLGIAIGSRLVIVVAVIAVLGGVGGCGVQLWRRLRDKSLSGFSAIVRMTFTKYILRYSLPTSAQTLFAFLKNEGPAVLLGHHGLFAQVAVYEIARRIFDVANKILPKLFDLFIPYLVAAMQRDLRAVKRGFLTLSWLELVFYLAVSSFLVLGYRWWTWLYGVPVTGQVAILFSLLGVNFILTGLIHPSVWAIELTNTTVSNLIGSILRSLVVFGFTLILLPRFEVVGAALASVLGTLLAVVAFCHFAAQTPFFSWRVKLQQCAVAGSVQIALFYLAVGRVGF